MSLDIELAKKNVLDVQYVFHKTTVVCIMETKCGSIFVGEAHCFDLEDYVAEIGKEEAYKNAFSKFLDAEAYLQRNLVRITEFLTSDDLEVFVERYK